MTQPRDHGGGLDAAVAAFGGARRDWLDLSTGINPVPYPVGDIDAGAWAALPDSAAMDRLLAAARAFWNVPDGAEIVAANGASAIIAAMPGVVSDLRAASLADTSNEVCIPGPTYNEHAAAFHAQGWTVRGTEDVAAPEHVHVHVHVHPNNPDGRQWADADTPGIRIIDESFCDVMPARSLVSQTTRDDRIVLKSFGKFWGLAGLRLGFAICGPEAAARFRDRLGPWAVSGPALEIGARALEDHDWAETTRTRLRRDATRLDRLVGWDLVGGTDLFHTYDVPDAAATQRRLARGHVWSRIFPYSKTWIRLGLPAPDRWDQLEAAL